MRHLSLRTTLGPPPTGTRSNHVEDLARSTSRATTVMVSHRSRLQRHVFLIDADREVHFRKEKELSTLFSGVSLNFVSFTDTFSKYALQPIKRKNNTVCNNPF